MTFAADKLLPAEFAAYAQIQGDTLRLGNALMERTWRVSGTALLPVSVTDKRSGFEWIVPPAPPAFSPALATLEQHLDDGGVGEPALRATVRITAPGQNTAGIYHFHVPGTVAALSVWVERSGDESKDASSPFLETLQLAPLHLRMAQVELRDQTDEHNELAFEHEWLIHPAERTVSLSGNLFWFEDVLSGRGLAVLKEAPLPHVRPISSEYDLRVQGSRELTVSTLPGIGDAGHRTTLLCYEGGAVGRIQTLHAYQRSLRRYDPARDGLFLSNTWGDRGQDAHLSTVFLAEEIAAAATLGVDVVQIDDGWQSGQTTNSAQAGSGRWEDFWSDLNFWSPHPIRFPEGLAPIVEAARAVGIKIGLWYAPDSTADFAHWSKDAQTILALHRLYHINHFKLDGIKIRSAQGEAAVQHLFEALLRESNGQIVCDLDVTAETRPGYFGAMEIGPLFVENRYTDWHGYWPHQTLRNLWKLAHYIDPLRLRVEVLNNERNMLLYHDDPLAPFCYAPAYLFAIACFACPLGWFETSGLSDAYLQSVASFVTVWKAHREQIYRGTILPIGQTPDGTSWTGFLSSTADSHYLLMFRELNTASAFAFAWPWAQEVYQAETLYGTGSVQVDGAAVRVEIGEKQSFLFTRLHK